MSSMDSLTKLRPSTVSRRLGGTIVHEALGAVLSVHGLPHRSSTGVSDPYISGRVQFLSTSSGGATTFQPVITPMIAVSIGEHG